MFAYRVKERLLKVDFVRFSLVGASGFAINFVLLTLLYKVLGLPLVVAQFLASEVALFSNFILHHHWTYKHKQVAKTFTKLIIQFHLTSWAAILGSVAMVTIGVHALHLNYFYALVLSSAVALLWNFFWSKYVIWHTHRIPHPSVVKHRPPVTDKPVRPAAHV